MCGRRRAVLAMLTGALLLGSCTPARRALAPHPNPRTTAAAGQAGAQDALDAELDRARDAYRRAAEAKAGPDGPGPAGFPDLVDYPGKRALIAAAGAGTSPAALDGRIAAALDAITLDPGRYGLTGAPSWDEAFWIDLAGALPSGRGWTVLARYLDRAPPQPPANLAAALAAAAPPGREGDDLLWARFGRGNWHVRQAVLEALRRRGTVTDQTLRDRLLSPGLPVQARAHLLSTGTVLSRAGSPSNRWLDLYEEAASRLPAPEALAFRRHLVQTSVWPATPPPEVLRRLMDLTRTAADPSLRQPLLARLWQATGDSRWLEQLARDVEASGWQAGVQPWEVYRQLQARYPRSRLAEGMRRYEQARGLPYFEWDRRDESYYWAMALGDEQYRPGEEIPAWRAFLERYPDHPGADDAAYRLGRSLEIRGDFPGALAALYRALTLPDGDMRPAAYGRILYILDTLPAEAFRTFHPWPRDLPDDLRVTVAYSEAVALLRESRYEEAAAALGRLLDEAGGPSSFRPRLLALAPAWESDGYPFGELVARQRHQARALAERARAAAAGTGTAAEAQARARYDLAAAVYRDAYLFYNHLWAGRRQAFFWVGGVNTHLYGALTPRFRDYVRRSHHLAQALPMFEALTGPDVPAAVRAPALFTVGRAYVDLLSAAQETHVLFPPDELRRRAAAALEAFLALRPRDPLADDALLLLAAATRDRRHLEALVARHPESDLRPRAEALLRDGLPCVGPALLPFGHVRPGDPALPAAVRSAVAELRASGRPGHRLVAAADGGTYLAVFRPGAVIRIDAVWPAGAGRADFHAGTGSWAERIRRIAGATADPDVDVVWIPFALQSMAADPSRMAGDACR